MNTMKIGREPATLEPAIKVEHQYIPIADYTKRQEIERERRRVREEYKGGLTVNRPG